MNLLSLFLSFPLSFFFFFFFFGHLLYQGEKIYVKTGRAVRQRCCHQFYYTYTAPEGFGDFKIGQVILTVKCADDVVLLAKDETVLQGMTDKTN
jgi:hypothetical protein